VETYISLFTAVAMVGLVNQPYRFTEGQFGELAICAEINGGILSLERDVTVILNTVDGSATSSGEWLSYPCAIIDPSGVLVHTMSMN